MLMRSNVSGGFVVEVYYEPNHLNAYPSGFDCDCDCYFYAAAPALGVNRRRGSLVLNCLMFAVVGC